MSNKALIRLIGSVILLVLIVIGYGFWYSIVTAESVQAGSLLTKIADQTDATAKIAQAKSQLIQLSTQEATVDQYFVETNDLVPFLEQLQASGKFLGTNVQVASVSAAPGDPYGNLSLSLSITGSFDAVVRTIGSIEYEPFNIKITSLSLNTSSALGTATTSSPQWTANASFSVGAKTGGVMATTTSTANAGTPITAAAISAPVLTNAPIATSTITATTTLAP